MIEAVPFNEPPIVLPWRERQGAQAFVSGFEMRDAQAIYGFAFCPYEFGSLERQNWLSGYARQMFAMCEDTDGAEQ